MPQLLTPTRHGLCEPQDERNWEQLIRDVQNGTCALFVGSGPSAPAFGKWRRLVDAVAAAVPVNPPVTCPADLASSAFPDFLEDCRARMTEAQYRAALEGVFDPRGKEPYRPVHSAMLRANFGTYVTTNVDNMIENAAEHQDAYIRPQGVQAFPDELSPVLLGRRAITHLHGRAYDSSGRMCLLPDVVLTRGDFERAYGQRPDIAQVVLHLLRSYNVVFVGFSADDGVLQRVLQTDLRVYLERLAPGPPRHRARENSPRRFYVLRDVPLRGQDGAVGVDRQDAGDARVQVKAWFAVPGYIVGSVAPILYATERDDTLHGTLDRLMTELQRKARYAAPVASQPLDSHVPYVRGGRV